MTIAVSPGWYFPEPNSYGGGLTIGAVIYANVVLDAAAEKAAWTFLAPKSGDIARIHFRTLVVTTGDAMKVSLQDVDPATGDPDGVADQFRTQAIVDTDDNTWFRSGLVTSDGTDTGTLRTVTRRQRLAVVIEFNSFVAGNMQIALINAVGGGVPYERNHYLDHFTAAWAKQNGRGAAMAIEYSDGTFAYIPNASPASTQVALAVNSGTTPDEIALRFQLPFPARIAGWWATLDLDGDADVILYDAAGSAWSSDAIDKDVRGATTAGTMMGLFDTVRDVAASTTYRLSVRPSTVTSLTSYYLTVHATPGQAILDQLSGGQQCYWSERTNAGAWTDNVLRRPMIGLYLEGFDDGVIPAGGIQSMFNNGID